MPDTRRLAARSVYILPNLFTTGSLFAAFFSIIMAIGGRMDTAALAILVSAVLDGLDGKVARLTGSASEFGIQYDSLADLVAFGVAPAILGWTWHLQAFGRLGVGVAFLYVACAALRLARFNVSAATTSKRFFVGLPSPAAGFAMATLVMAAPVMPNFIQPFMPYLALGVSFAAPLLMVSRVRYFSFKEYGFVSAHPFRTLVSIVLLFVLIFSWPRHLGFILCLSYLASGLVYTFVLLPRRNRQILRHLAANPGAALERPNT